MIESDETKPGPQLTQDGMHQQALVVHQAIASVYGDHPHAWLMAYARMNTQYHVELSALHTQTRIPAVLGNNSS